MIAKTNNNWVQMTDNTIVHQIGQFVKHTRLNRNKSQKQIAESAGLNRYTISKIENGESITLSSLIKVLRVLDSLYVLESMQVNNEISPLAYAKIKKEKRERASTKKGNNMVNEENDLGW